MACKPVAERRMQIVRMWCVGLLVVAGLHAAEAQLGSGSYGEPGTQGPYGYGGYGYGQPEELSMFLGNALEVGPQYGRRSMLAQGPAVQDVPASLVTDSSSSSSGLKADIVPLELPITTSWDSHTRQSWEQWYAEHIADSAAGSTIAQGLYGTTGSYGDGGQYGYGGGSYGTHGAYFDFKSKTTIDPQGIQGGERLQQQQTAEQRPIPDAAPDAIAANSSNEIVNVAQVLAKNKPAIGGVSRGRGLAVRQFTAKGKSRAGSSASSTAVPRQQHLSESAQAVSLPLKETPVPVSPARRLLSKALRVFNNRKMLMNKQSAEEVLWAFRQ